MSACPGRRRLAAAGCALALLLAGPGSEAAGARASLRAGEYAAAEQAARALLDTGGSAAYLDLGHALAAQGRVDEAIQAYAQARDGAGRTPLDARLASARLQVLYRDAAAGRRELEAILERYRQDPGALGAAETVAAGHAARDLATGNPGLYRDALAAYEAAIAKAPEDADAHVAIGELLLDRFNNAEALEAFRAALGVDPEHPGALLGLARSQHFDHSSATRDGVERVLAVNPRQVDALSLLATLQMELEEYDAARDTLARAVAVNPNAPRPLTQLAALSLLRGDPALFDEQVAQVRRIAPGYGELYETLAAIAAQNRRYAEAARLALLAVTLNRESWRGHALLGVNRLRLGDMDNGRRSLEVAFRGDPFDPFTKNALELLDRLDGYTRIRSARFELVAEPGEAAILAALFLPIAERAYDAFEQAYDYRPRAPVRIEFYPRHEDFSVRTVGLVGVDIVGVSFGPVVAMDSPSAGVFGPLNAGSVLWHELAHTFHLGMTDSRVPRWFSEGLAVFEERRGQSGWGADVTPGFLSAWKEGRLPKPSELNQLFLRPSAPEVLLHGYYLASLLMELIEREHGFEAIAGLLRAYGDGRTTEQAVREVLGREPGDLDAAFDAFMKTRFEAAAKALSPGGGQASYPELLDGARAAMGDGDLERALAQLRTAQTLLPELAGAHGTYRLLARVHEQRGEPALAIDQLERNLSIDADDLEAHRSLARLYEAGGNLRAAAGVLSRSLLIAPFEADSHRRLAELREALEEWPQAIAARSAVVDLDETDPARARYLLARAHHLAGDAGPARRQVIKALEIAPLYDEALELLLRIRERGGAS